MGHAGHRFRRDRCDASIGAARGAFGLLRGEYRLPPKRQQRIWRIFIEKQKSRQTLNQIAEAVGRVCADFAAIEALYCGGNRERCSDADEFHLTPYAGLVVKSGKMRFDCAGFDAESRGYG